MEVVWDMVIRFTQGRGTNWSNALLEWMILPSEEARDTDMR